MGLGKIRPRVDESAAISPAEFTHPVIASLDLPSLPQAVKRAEESFSFSHLFPPQAKRGRPA